MGQIFYHPAKGPTTRKELGGRGKEFSSCMNFFFPLIYILARIFFKANAETYLFSALRRASFFSFTNPCTNTVFFVLLNAPPPSTTWPLSLSFHNFFDGPSLMRGGRGADIVCLRGPIIREGQVQLWTDIFPLKNKCK